MTGGNVSLYNESRLGVIDPTPTIGMVGLIDEEAHITTQWFKSAGDLIILIGPPATTENPAQALGGSRFLKVCHGRKQGPVPDLDLKMEMAVQDAVRQLIQQRLIRSAHDCSEGGLAVGLVESCFSPDQLQGAEIDLPQGADGKLGACAALFNESQSRILVSIAKENLDQVSTLLRERDVPFQPLGRVTGNDLCIRLGAGEFRWPVVDLYDDWWNAIRRAVDQEKTIPSL